MAGRVFEILGDQLTKSLLAADFDLYRTIVTLPLTFASRGGKPYTLTDDARLRADFDLYVSIIKLHGVTDIYRRVLEVNAVGADEMLVRCITYILVRATLLADPFETRMRLRLIGNQWRIAEIESTLGHLNWTRGRVGISSIGQFETTEE